MEKTYTQQAAENFIVMIDPETVRKHRDAGEEQPIADMVSMLLKKIDNFKGLAEKGLVAPDKKCSLLANYATERTLFWPVEFESYNTSISPFHITDLLAERIKEFPDEVAAFLEAVVAHAYDDAVGISVQTNYFERMLRARFVIATKDDVWNIKVASHAKRWFTGEAKPGSLIKLVKKKSIKRNDYAYLTVKNNKGSISVHFA